MPPAIATLPAPGRRGIAYHTLSLFGVVVALLLADHAEAQTRWVSGWTFVPTTNLGPAAPPSPPNPNDVRGPPGPGTVDGQTLSQTLTIAASGTGLRLRFSNRYGADPVQLYAASVSVDGGLPLPVTFDGQRQVVIPAGAPRLSDPVEMPVEALDTITVSLFYPGQTALPLHRLRQVAREGDATAEVLPASSQAARFGVLLNAVDVRTERSTPVIVAFGDSITEGVSASPAGPGGWPERLLRRLVDASSPWAVVSAGIAGNRLLHRGSGPSGLERLDADALAVPGARCLVLLEGINDIGRPTQPTYAHETISADDLIAGYRQVIARAHAAGMNTVLGTIMPFEGAAYFTAEGETVRQAVNAWIRTSGEADGVVDFDAALRDPANPSRLASPYDSGDRLHPSDAGYQAMADTVPIDVCDPKSGDS